MFSLILVSPSASAASLPSRALFFHLETHHHSVPVEAISNTDLWQEGQSKPSQDRFYLNLCLQPQSILTQPVSIFNMELHNFKVWIYSTAHLPEPHTNMQFELMFFFCCCCVLFVLLQVRHSTCYLHYNSSFLQLRQGEKTFTKWTLLLKPHFTCDRKFVSYLASYSNLIC